MPNSLYISFFKRFFDFWASLGGLLILSPLFLVIAFIIKIQDRGPVFFRQERIGRYFRPFYIYKFRTMVVNAHKMGPPITKGDDPRITPIGKFLRKFKFDELPQLLNVFKGDMSIVGPRPEVKKYVEIFKEDYKKILQVRPGITDYATIYFRNEEEILKRYDNPEEAYIKEILPQKIILYKKYIKNMGFFTDLKLIFLTLWRIINVP